MKILLLHNYYTQRGGEDGGVFEAERNLLLQKGHEVESLTFQNQKLQRFAEKIRTSFSSIYNRHSAKILARKIDEFQPQIFFTHT